MLKKLKNIFKKKSDIPPIPPVIIAPAPRVAVKQEPTDEPPVEQTMYFDEVATEGKDLVRKNTESTQDADPTPDTELTIIEEEPIKIELTLKGTTGDIDIVLNESSSIVTLGRGKAENDITIDDPRASRKHCQLILDANEKTVAAKDLDSSNGTKVNGEAIEVTTVLNNGDVLTIGRSEYELNFD